MPGMTQEALVSLRLPLPIEYRCWAIVCRAFTGRLRRASSASRKFVHHRVEAGTVLEAVAGALHHEEGGSDAGFLERGGEQFALADP